MAWKTCRDFSQAPPAVQDSMVLVKPLAGELKTKNDLIDASSGNTRATTAPHAIEIGTKQIYIYICIYTRIYNIYHMCKG